MEISIVREDKGALRRTIPQVEPGTEVIYAIGAYCHGPHKEDAYALYMKGDVDLYQRRSVAKGVFNYIARKRKTRRKDV